MNWIGLAPAILIEKHGMVPMTYGLWQLPVFGAMIAGNVGVARLAGRWPLERVTRWGLYAMVAGVLTALVGEIASASFMSAVPGLALYAFGIGPFYAGIFRQALFAPDSPKGTVSAAINTLFMLLMAVGVEVSKTIYIDHGETALLTLDVTVVLIGAWAAARFAARMREEPAQAGEPDPMPL
jgi:MFS transporter, DHA1 family, multidrug/chloramphenicol efflux transport protein